MCDQKSCAHHTHVLKCFSHVHRTHVNVREHVRVRFFFRNSQFTEKVEVETQKLLEMQKAETEAQKLLQQQQAEAEMKQFIRQQQVEAQQLMQEQTVNNPLFDDLLKYYSNL